MKSEFPKVKRAETVLGHFSIPRVLEERRSRARWAKALAEKLHSALDRIAEHEEKLDASAGLPLSILADVDKVRVELSRQAGEDIK